MEEGALKIYNENTLLMTRLPHVKRKKDIASLFSKIHTIENCVIWWSEKM